MKKRSDFPFLSLNGAKVPDDRIQIGKCKEKCDTWSYRSKESIVLTQLEIGLRKQLRQIIAQEGSTVDVEVLSGMSMSKDLGN